jgi:phosphatidylserine decarboxylase
MNYLKIHKEGTLSIIIAFVIVAALSWITFYSNIHLFLKFFILLFSLLLFLSVISFFRVPKRTINRDENAIVSPADGTIIQILEEIIETEYFNDKRKLISIFMSPTNVHVNSYPVDGEVSYVKYHPGKHFVASLPKASKDNEHNTVVQKHTNGEEVLFRQIAGFLARRVVSYAKKGEFAEQGEEMGIIKFGSRVDIFFPLSAKINVKMCDKVKSKITHLAYFS